MEKVVTLGVTKGHGLSSSPRTVAVAVLRPKAVAELPFGGGDAVRRADGEPGEMVPPPAVTAKATRASVVTGLPFLSVKSREGSPECRRQRSRSVQ